jgi:hypothetical protein
MSKIVAWTSKVWATNYYLASRVDILNPKETFENDCFIYWSQNRQGRVERHLGVGVGGGWTKTFGPPFFRAPPPTSKKFSAKQKFSREMLAMGGGGGGVRKKNVKKTFSKRYLLYSGVKNNHF